MARHSTTVRTPLALALAALLSVACGCTSAARQDSSAASAAAGNEAFAINAKLGRGINLGNALDAPSEGEWGVKLEESHFKLVREAGFTSVRIPVRFSAHAEAQPPYRIDPAFMDRVDWAVTQALANDLAIVLNFHHYNAMYENPQQELPRFLAMWEQVAARFKDRPQTLVFEILNQPVGRLDDGTWNQVLPQALEVIRKSNPTRVVMAGPAGANTLGHLPAFTLPASEQRLIVTIHYYDPTRFTHQGASWVEGSDQWLGTQWTGSEAERKAIADDFDKIADWARQNNRPVYLGEFGAFSAADADSRARWTRFIVESAEKRGMSWGYWEFCSSFGVYDPDARQWRQPLLKALLQTAP